MRKTKGDGEGEGKAERTGETETVGEPRVRKKAQKTDEKCFSDAFKSG